MAVPSLSALLPWVVAAVAVALLLRQCRKPSWLPGRMYLSLMNRSHSALTDWGLGHVAIAPDDTVLDVGCGGGRTLAKLAAAAPRGRVYGVDYSEASVAMSRRTNRELIAAGRVDVRRSAVSRLPFEDRVVDLVTAVETHYYWPEPVGDFAEILRVLKPGGRLVVIAEAYRTGADPITPQVMKLLGGSSWTVAEHRDLLSAAGYVEVELYEQRERGWLCAVARRPLGSAVPATSTASEALG